MKIHLAHLSSCQRHSETVRFHCHGWFFPFMLETTLPQAHSFIHVACPIAIHSAPILTKSNTACPPHSALSLPKSIFLDLQLLAANSHCKCELEHCMDLISSFAQSPLFSVLRQVDGVCVLRQATCWKWTARLHVQFAVCVRACMHYLHQSRGWSHPGLTVTTALFGSRIQRPSSNPYVGKFIPMQSEINKTSSKNLGWLRVSS